MNNYNYKVTNKFSFNLKIKILKTYIVFIILFIHFVVNSLSIKIKRNKNKYINIEYNNYINVAYAFDKKYHYITHCSMKSIMLSQNNDTFINFYILVSSNIKVEHKSIIDRIGKQHKNCKIKYFYIDNNKFKKLNPKNWSIAVFYRLILQDLLKYEHKILYLDCDTIIYKDLTKIYNYDINGKYYIGMLEPKDPNLELKIDNFINTGVLLLNLDELRKGKIFEKIINFLLTHKYNFPINDSINYICYKKNGYFSPEFVQWGFCNEYFVDIYINNLTLKINKQEVLKSYKDPYIYHLIGNWKKPWKGVPYFKGKICVDPFIRFYEIARKTDYYYNILDSFKI